MLRKLELTPGGGGVTPRSLTANKTPRRTPREAADPKPEPREEEERALLSRDLLKHLSNFAPRPRELSGAVDLVSRYNLLVHHDFFCKKHLPMSILDTHYLHTVVGGTEIRKGEGMLLGQLIQNTSYNRETNVHLQPFDLDILTDAFDLRETTPVELPENEKGVPTIFGKSKGEAKDKDKDKEKEKKHKKRKDREKDKNKENKKLKHRHKDKDKETKKDRSSIMIHSKKHHEKKGWKFVTSFEAIA
ncbi:mediator of RNA polymerase II transcription subunit 19a [Gossypium hirsutum]|uniref:Mediator of RNA polymerase II transcription subunit 19a n=4 Tax=Gossypium TaxID=3633 RepID=A0ABM2YMT7_GOSHI|nr:mediator of RNA polymerase II transcription subunit 19a [Gossypium hirsutum]